MNKASFLQRFAAWSIDRITLSIIYILAAFAVGAVSGIFTNSRIQVPDLLLSPSVSGIILAPVFGHFSYFGYFWSRRERSIGMGLMNIRVVRTDGQPLSFVMAGLRGSDESSEADVKALKSRLRSVLADVFWRLPLGAALPTQF